MNEQLKPCPFCERRNTYLSKSDAPYSYFVRCEDCNASGPVVATEEQAIREWNERADPKAAPLVWEGNADDDNPKAFLSKNPDVFFICYETMGVGYRALLKCGVEIVWDECGFGTMDKARAACQSCADAVFFKLLTGKEPK